MAFQISISDVFNISPDSTMLIGSRDTVVGGLTPAEGRKGRLFQDGVMVCDVTILGVALANGPNLDDSKLPLSTKLSSPVPGGPTFGEWILKTID